MSVQIVAPPPPQAGTGEHLTPRVARAASHFSQRCRGWLTRLGFVASILLATPVQAAAVAPTLGTAQSFAVLGASTVTNTGPSIITGDLGLSPGTSITGFPPGSVSGTIHQTDAAATSAQAAARTAYSAIDAQSCDFGPYGPTDLAGQTLAPGVYCYSSSVQNSGTVTLSGTASDVWVFRAGSTLTTGSGSSFVAEGGAQNCNVFWQVGSSAALGTTSNLPGSIIATTSITLNTGASLSGRALALNGAVTLDSNNVSVCALALPAKLGLDKIVDNVGGGSATAAQFTLTASGPTLISGAGQVLPVNAPIGVYTLTETNLANYTAGLFRCIGGGILAGNQLTIAAADAGKTITCRITNTFAPNPAKLSLDKIVSGGTATKNQFTLTANGPTIISGPAQVLAVNAPVGVYTLTESNLANYTAGLFSCIGGGSLSPAGNQLTIAAADAGKTIICTITNTFNAAIVPSSIPTLSEWAMLILASLLAIVGFATLRRQEVL